LSGWRKARLDEVPDTTEPGFWNEWAREPDFGGNWRSLGTHLQITGFGINANQADAGRELIVPHSETEYGEQEELYLVLSGRARFVLDGELVELSEGELVVIPHEVQREATALEDGTRVLCVGGTPGRPYEPL
jgi:mannose-6-phosphate isomerase-like protein (cupin superfamily)